MKPKAEKKAKTYQLDLFKETLPALYKCDFDFYERCTPEQRKEISPLILMRWVSLAESYPEAAPALINMAVNQGFWTLSKHPELQWKQLCVAASEMGPRTPRHKWMMPKKSTSKTPILDGYLLRINPYVNDAELEIIRSKIPDEDAIKEMVKSFGDSDANAKEVIQEYRKHYGKNRNEEKAS